MLIFQKSGKCIKAVNGVGIIVIGKTNENILERGTDNVEGKQLHSTNTEFINRKTSNWLIKGNLKKDTESTMMAVQGRSMRTRI